MKISLVAALGRNGVIGNRGKIPWLGDMRDDMKHFKELTSGHVVIMGRKTWESLPKKSRPLPKRTNIILTRDKNFNADNVLIANSLLDIKDMVRGEEEIFIIGGSEIYKLFGPMVDRMYLTLIDHEFVGDTYFPEIAPRNWNISSITPILKNHRNRYPAKIVRFDKQSF